MTAMLRLTLLVLLATKSILAFEELETYDSLVRNVDDEGRLLPGTANKISAVANLPTYVAVVTDGAGPVMAAVIIVNRYWVVGTQAALGSITDPKTLLVYAKVLSIADLTATDVMKRRGKAVFKDTTYDATKPILKPLVLLRICPSFPANIAASLTTTSFPMATDVRMMMYKTDNLYYEEKKVGEICECETIPDFQTDAASTHVCLQEHETIKGETADLGLLVVSKKSDGAVVGLLVKEQGATGGEVVINVPKFSSWITTNAVPAAP